MHYLIHKLRYIQLRFYMWKCFPEARALKVGIYTALILYYFQEMFLS